MNIKSTIIASLLTAGASLIAIQGAVAVDYYFSAIAPGVSGESVEEDPLTTWEEYATSNGIYHTANFDEYGDYNFGSIVPPDALYPNSAPWWVAHTGSDMTNANWLASVTYVETLELNNNNLLDINGLSNIKNFDSIDISGNPYTNVNALGGISLDYNVGRSLRSINIASAPNLLDISAFGTVNLGEFYDNGQVLIYLDSDIHTRSGFAGISATSDFCTSTSVTVNGPAKADICI